MGSQPSGELMSYGIHGHGRLPGVSHRGRGRTENRAEDGDSTAAMAILENLDKATRWLSWYGVGLASADRLPVVVRIPAGLLGSLKCDPPKGNGRRPQKNLGKS